VDWTTLSLEQVQKIFVETLVGFVYLPTHFPLANELVPYREQIGKRPPFATVELFWCPYDGEALLASGFVHPPTEEMARSAFALRGTKRFMTIKGLEGSCDLPRDRTCIVGVNHVSDTESTFERLLLHPRDYGFAAEEVPLLPTPKLAAEMRSVLQGSQTELSKAAIWNSGFYLWRSGLSPSLESGFTQAEELLASGKAAQKLTELAQSIQAIDRAASIRITENTPV
jgi:anthranilate phosphoribosyltransferase